MSTIFTLLTFFFPVKNPSNEVMDWLESLPFYDDMVKVMGKYDHSIDYVGPEDSWKSKLIPRNIWGIDINIAAYIHDYWYTKDAGKGPQRRFEIDAIFLVDMMKIIEMSKSGPVTRNLARLRACKYYAAVREAGKGNFK